MSYRHQLSPRETASLRTAELRSSFLVENLFEPGTIRLVPTGLDRAIIGGIQPLAEPLALLASDDLRADYFLQRRELGVINLGAPGAVQVDGEEWPLGSRECLYIGRGRRDLSFISASAAAPAAFYLVSYPAHASYPLAYAKLEDANAVALGNKLAANERTIYQYIHEGGIPSCQLVMGFTELAPGSVWNTMPPHTHARRSEIYCYFDIPEGDRVLHLMGEPEETRLLWVSDRQAVLSPDWSIHSGTGTASYSFVWAMGGENQRFDDMDPAPLATLR